MRVIGFKEVKLDRISVPDWARRTVLDGEAIDEIAESIETYGQLEPVIVRDLGDGNYELIAGYQRYLAMRKRGRSTVEAKVIECTDEEALTLSIEENEKRAEEHPFDVAKKVAYMHGKVGLSTRKIAKRLGKDDSWIAKMLKINEIDEEAKKVLGPKVRDIEKLYSLAKIDDPEKQRIAANYLVKHDLSREGVEDLAKKANSMPVEEFRAYCEGLLKEGGEGHGERAEGRGVLRMRSTLQAQGPSGDRAEGAGNASTLTSLQAQGTPPTSQEGSGAPGTGSPPQDQGQHTAQGPQTGQEQRKGPETYTCSLCREKRERFKIKFYGFCNDRHDELHGMLWDLRGLPQEEIDSIFTVLLQVKDFLLTYPKEQRAEMAKGIAEIAPYLKALDLERVKEVVEEVKRRLAQN
jgi:ParB/RepB/Spo0J family partition protein